MFGFFIRNIRTHQLLAIGGLSVDTFAMVDGPDYATSFTNSRDAQAYVDQLHDNFAGPLAGEHFEVYPARYI